MALQSFSSIPKQSVRRLQGLLDLRGAGHVDRCDLRLIEWRDNAQLVLHRLFSYPVATGLVSSASV